MDKITIEQEAQATLEIFKVDKAIMVAFDKHRYSIADKKHYIYIEDENIPKVAAALCHIGGSEKCGA